MIMTNMIVLSSSSFVSLLCNDRIRPEKFKVGNRFDTDENFIKAVIKIQQQKEGELTAEEAKTVEPWKLKEELEHLEEPCSLFEQRIREREKKIKQATQQFQSSYDPAIMQCVGGSAAEAERVWSMAGHVLTEHHASLSPLVFELIMYPKYNSRLWDISDVVEAIKRRRNDSEAMKNRLALHQERLNRMRGDVTDWDQEIH